MKQRLLFLFTGILLIGFVSAATCSDDQTIMRLYQGSNSHVSFWNESIADYTEEICYDVIFGSPYVGANPHDCTGTNRVLSLYDVSNSHASNVSDVNYDDDVCFGNLECVYEADSAWSGACDNGGKVVARMYSGINSHVSNASGANYFNRICCVSSAIYWADANGNEITKADEVNIGDTIQAIMTNTASGTFNIWEEDDGFVGFILGGDDDIKTITGVNVGGNLIGEWLIVQNDLNKTADFEDFYFNVDGGESSDSINISGTYDDSPMNITIISPDCGDNYSKGGEVEIIVSASDEDDFLEGNVSINGVVVETFVNGGVTFNYTFVLDGNFQIIAEAVNSREKRARHIANIMIVDISKDGSYVAACIDKPKDFSDIEEAEVTFDASTTRAIAVSGGLAKPFSPEVYPTNFSWDWKFSPAGVTRNPFIKSSSSLAYRFNVTFPIAGQNSASLQVDFE